MKGAVNLTYQGESVKEFFVGASKLYKDAKYNVKTKHSMIIEAIQSDHGFLYFVLLRKATMFDEVKETCQEYAEHQKLYALPE